MLGGLAAKHRWRAARRAAGKPADQPNLVCGPVQVCWEKFARYFDVEMREAPMTPGRTRSRPSRCSQLCDENTIAVVVTLGQTFTGLFEDVAAIAGALDELEARSGPRVPIHVDAASGGLLAPVHRARSCVWDFRLPRVRSINASGSQDGPRAARLRLGAVARDGRPARGADLQRQLPRRRLPDLQPQLLPPRRARSSRSTTSSCGSAARATPGCTAPATRPRRSARDRRLPGFSRPRRRPAARHPRRDVADRPADLGFNLFDLADRLRTHGWLVPAYTLPAELQDMPCSA